MIGSQLWIDTVAETSPDSASAGQTEPAARESKSVWLLSHKQIVASMSGISVCVFTLEVMNSSLVSMSGVSRQARNLREVLEVRSCNIPAAGQGDKRTSVTYTIFTVLL